MRSHKLSVDKSLQKKSYPFTQHGTPTVSGTNKRISTVHERSDIASQQTKVNGQVEYVAVYFFFWSVLMAKLLSKNSVSETYYVHVFHIGIDVGP